MAEPPQHDTSTFDKLSVHIDKDVNFVLSGLRKGFEGEVEKTSASLGRQAVYTKKSRISKLPYYLCVQFVRFYWNREAQGKAKIMRPVEFPLKNLDLFEFLTPELQAELKEKRLKYMELENDMLTGAVSFKKKRKMGEGGGSQEEDGGEGDGDAMTDGDDGGVTANGDAKGKGKVADLAAAAAAATEKEEAAAAAATTTRQQTRTPVNAMYNDTAKYELVGVISHKGRSGNSGHYVAWVKEKENAWLCYDDDTVTVVDDNEIKKLGGKGGGDWHIAYLCIYRSTNMRDEFDRLAELVRKKTSNVARLSEAEEAERKKREAEAAAAKAEAKAKAKKVNKRPGGR